MKVDAHEDRQDELVLECTERRVYANCTILGLTAFGDGDYGHDRLYEGYDGYVGMVRAFTTEERHEIADHMIARWKLWREGKAS